MLAVAKKLFIFETKVKMTIFIIFNIILKNSFTNNSLKAHIHLLIKKHCC